MTFLPNHEQRGVGSGGFRLEPQCSVSLPDKVFTCVCCFIVFNIMDLAGRGAPSLVQWVSLEDLPVSAPVPTR